jgi:hypothetical protein
LLFEVVVETAENEQEGDAGFGVGADDALDVVELLIESVEELVEVHGVELVVEAVHGFVVAALALDVAVLTEVGAAEALVAEGDGPAEFAGGQELGAEVYWFRCCHGGFSLKIEKDRFRGPFCFLALVLF